MQLFDIIFQSGEFYYQDSKEIIEIVVTSFISIVSLIGGFLLNYWYENHKEKKKIKRLVLEFLFETQLLIKPLEEQSKKFKEFSEKLQVKNKESLELILVNNLINLEKKFNAYSKSEIVRYFLSGKNKDKNQILKDIHGLFEHIFYIGKIITISESTSKELKEDLNEHTTIWDKNILNIAHKINEYYSQYKAKQIEIPKDQYIVDAVSIFLTHTESPDKSNLYVAIDTLINPLITLRQKHIQDVRVFDIQESLTECSVAFRELNKSKILYSERYLKFSENMNDMRKYISEILIRLNQT